MKADVPPTVLELILKWSQGGRPEWQRDALRRIVEVGDLEKEDVEDLVLLCKRESGDTEVSREPVPLDQKHLQNQSQTDHSISLHSIRDVKGVNRLAPGQTLSFAPSGMTIIYGQNGSGKSGYARILKKACRARVPEEIRPDAFTPEYIPPSATLRIRDDAGAEEDIAWTTDLEDERLVTVTVFDRASAERHIRSPNDAFFTPFGMDIPKKLKSVLQDVKAHLEAEAKALETERNAVFDDPIWNGRSDFGWFLDNLTATSDPSTVFERRAYSDEDEQRRLQLEADIGNPEKTAAGHTASAGKIDRLKARLHSLESALSPEAIRSFIKATTDLKAAQEAAQLAAEAAFGELELEGVGGPVWKALWDSARRFNESMETPSQPFPPGAGDICLLCHQNIGKTAADRMAQFEAFVQADTEQAASDAKETVDKLSLTLSRLEISTRTLSTELQILRQYRPALAASVTRFLASARLRRREVLLKQVRPDILVRELELVPEADLTNLAAQLRRYAEELLQSAGDNDDLRNELANLTDHKQADRLKAIAEAEIARLKALQVLEKGIGSCAHRAVTNLAKSVADEVMTPRIRDRFQDEIVRLAGRQVRVQIEQTGKDGAAQYAVRVTAAPKAKTESILSEGEQTCVALAAFMTELTNANHHSALVFDDPVSSLDHRWRSKVARRLAEEALTRQVIVFSHDLAFVNDLEDIAEKTKVPVRIASLSRSTAGHGIVSEDMPWLLQKVRERIDKLEKHYRAAKASYEANDDERYAEQVSALYSALRATWERALEDLVFGGVVTRYREEIKTGHLWRVKVVTPQDIEFCSDAIQKCHDYVDAHDYSRGRNKPVPDPVDVMNDIAGLKHFEADLRRRQNDLKKALKADV